MGHYRSEMGYDEQDRQEAQRKAERLAARIERLEAEIKARGIASLLAEMLEDDVLFRIRYR